jgi:cytochrome bd-type quinol oxidase subunit 1
VIYLLPVVAALFALVVYLLHREHSAFKAWDIERGRYVAALLSQTRAGDLAASSVVRAQPTRPAEPKPPQPVMEGM